MKHFYTNREQCEVLTGYLSLWYRPGLDWTNAWDIYIYIYTYIYIYIYTYIHTQTHTFFAVYRRWSGKINNIIGTAMNATCQGNISAYHFGHECHMFVITDLWYARHHKMTQDTKWQQHGRLIVTLKIFVWGYCLEKLEFVSEPSSLETHRNKTYKYH